MIRLLDAAHQQLQAPIVLAWDRLSLHKPSRSGANLVVTTATGLAAAVKNRLNRMPYRTRLIDGYLTATGLSPPTPSRP